MLKNFRAYQLSLEFNRSAQKMVLPYHLRDQLQRAASSVCLNLAEGSGRFSPKDQRKFYSISLGSLRECQCIIEISEQPCQHLVEMADKLGALIYKLIRSRE